MSQYRLDSFELWYFNLKAKVQVDSRYVPDTVLKQAEAALLTTFSFANRNFGQPVTAAEVISIIQSIPGVVYVDLDELYLIQQEQSDQSSEDTLSSILPARRAKWTPESKFELAQLLLANPVGIIVEEMKS